MDVKPYRNFDVAMHITGWVVFFTIPLLIAPGPGLAQYISTPETLYGFLLKTTIWMAVFYSNLIYITPLVLKKKTTPLFVMLLIVIIVLIGIGVGWIDIAFNRRFHGDFKIASLPHLNKRPGGMIGRVPGPGFAGPFFSNLLITLIVFVVSSLIVLSRNWRTAKELEQERMLQKVAVELSLLKLQISPHFLFNTLNNIRWLVRSGSDRAEPAIVKLSQLLRYILYQTNTEYVSLGKEIEHLQDFISLHQMRLTNTHAFSFEVNGEPSDKPIVPLLLLPLAENLFKYGDFAAGAQNYIIITITDSQLNFSAVNRKMKPSINTLESDTRGIGMENLKRRLILYYPQRHSIVINEMNEIYSVALTIDLR